MKKFIILFLILLLIGGCIFYFGWIQILLPAETYAVIFTKTGGYDSEVIKPGVFSWRWERLIPTNMSLFKFDLKAHSTELTYHNALPSSELYASILPEKVDFDFEAAVYVKFRLKPENLPGLVAEEKLFPETLSDYYQRTAAGFLPKIMGLALEEAQGSLLPDEQWDSRLKSRLEESYPHLELFSLQSRITRVPDLELYSLAKESYRKLLKSREESLQDAAAQIALQQEMAKLEAQKEQAALKLLGEYGELFTRQPVLLKVYYIQKLSGTEEFEIPELKSLELFESSEPAQP